MASVEVLHPDAGGDHVGDVRPSGGDSGRGILAQSRGRQADFAEGLTAGNTHPREGPYLSASPSQSPGPTCLTSTL